MKTIPRYLRQSSNRGLFFYGISHKKLLFIISGLPKFFIEIYEKIQQTRKTKKLQLYLKAVFLFEMIFQ